MSKDKNIYIKFIPILDRYANINLCIFQTLQHQVFGTFSGEIKI
jgi:hypothetical protein